MLEKLVGNGRTARNSLDAFVTSRKKQCEKTSMLQLRNVYTYGLHDLLGDEYKKNDTRVVVDNKLPPLYRKHSRIFCNTSPKANNLLSPDEFFI